MLDASVGLEPPQQFWTGHAGHHDVEQYQVHRRLILGGEPDLRLAAAGGNFDLVPQMG